MCIKNNDSKPAAAQERSNADEDVSLEELGSISGAGNPWEGVKSVPQRPIDEKLREKA